MDLFHGKNAQQYAKWGGYLKSIVYKKPLKEILKLGTFSKILDAGCGPGILTCSVAESFKNAKVVGVDNSEDMINLARERAEKLGLSIVEFHTHNLMDPLPAEEKYDLIYSTYVMHHVNDPGRALENLWDALALGGVLFIYDLYKRFFLPHGTSWKSALKWREVITSHNVENVELKKLFPMALYMKAVKT